MEMGQLEVEEGRQVESSNNSTVSKPFYEIITVTSGFALWALISSWPFQRRILACVLYGSFIRIGFSFGASSACSR